MSVIVREWRMDALHDLYALGDPNEIIGRVDAMNEHNACVTALREALADAARMKEAMETISGAIYEKRAEVVMGTDAAALAEIITAISNYANSALAALGQEESR